MRKKTLVSILLVLGVIGISILANHPCISEEIGIQEEFDTLSNWRDGVWKGDRTAHITAKEGIATITHEKYDHGWISKSFKNLDVDKYPLLEIKVTEVKKGSLKSAGLIKFSYADKENHRIAEISAEGIYRVNYKEKTGWQGVKKQFGVFIIIYKDASISIDYIRFVAEEEIII